MKTIVQGIVHFEEGDSYIVREEVCVIFKGDVSRDQGKMRIEEIFEERYRYIGDWWWFDGPELIANGTVSNG